MDITIDLQNPYDYPEILKVDEVTRWINCALTHIGYDKESAELTVRIVDEAESQQLNSDYRSKHRPTNILSFPFEAPAQIACDLLGDLIICYPIIESEAAEQNKDVINHWAHMLIHGTLHLLGFDHIEDSEAEIMESYEVAILAKLGITNPY